VLAASAITLVVARIAPAALSDHQRFGDWLFAGLALAIALAYVPRFRVSRTLRVALVLPIAQLVAIGVAAATWSSLAKRAEVMYMTTCFATRGMALGTTIELALACGAAGYAIACRRSRARSRTARSRRARPTPCAATAPRSARCS
jgi:hypothetical protein